jgi:hypothetical protein
MDKTKYGKHILSNAFSVINPNKPVPKLGLMVDSDSWGGIGDVKCNFAFICISEPLAMPDPPHSHEFDEFIYFISGDATNIKYLGAEIEISLGQEMEKHVFTTPSVVYIPKGMLHCPLVIKKVDKPFYFGHIAMTPKYSKKK